MLDCPREFGRILRDTRAFAIAPGTVGGYSGILFAPGVLGGMEDRGILYIMCIYPSLPMELDLGVAPAVTRRAAEIPRRQAAAARGWTSSLGRLPPWDLSRSSGDCRSNP